MSETGFFQSYRGTVQADWIDVNDHMNVACYDRVFDAAESRLFDEAGVDETYAGRTGFGLFRLEKMLRYERELRLGEEIAVHSYVLFFDGRFVHHFHELINLSRGIRAAICDGLSIHVDLTQRKAAPVHLADVSDKLAVLQRLHGRVDPPPGVVDRRRGRPQ